VLGVSDSHDAGAALVVGGRLVAAINEERLNRRKMAAGMPLAALDAIWDVAGVRPEEVTAVGLAGRSTSGAAIPMNNDFSDDAGRHLASQLVAESIDAIPGARSVLASPAALAAYRGLMPLRAARRRGEVQRLLAEHGVRATVRAFDHHDAHLASAYYTSGHADALVLSNDGFGDGLCAKVAVGDRSTRRLRNLAQNSFFNSLGVYYNFVTLFCGFRKSHHAGKTTGLAAYGDPARTLPVFRELLAWDEAEGMYRNRGRVFRNCIADLRRRLEGVSPEDAAAGIQHHCEDLLTAMARHYVAKLGSRHLALVGGVHANVKINQRIAAIEGLESFFVFPNMGDGGLAAGAAFLAAADDVEGGVAPHRLEHVYLGPDYGEAAIAAAIERHGLQAARMADPAQEVAALLAADRVVARFAGAMEFGPRALGNRSILYPATKPEVNKWLNQQLRRTEFMPFAPVIREQDATAFLRGYTSVTAHTAQFMTLTYDVTERCKREAPAITHVDGTARPQVLRPGVNPGYHAILDAYHRATGLSVLVNTSFNMHEEPIVCTPEDAVRAFLDSNIDALAAGPFLLLRPGR